MQKMTLISRVLVNEGHNVNIISNWTMFTEKDHPELKKEGTFHGINYHYSTNSPYRPEKSFSRKWQHFLGIIREFNYLRKLKKEDRLDFAILSTHKFQSILYYVLVSKFLGYKTILNYVEFYSGIKKKK